MASRSPFTDAALNAFAAAHDTANEDTAQQTRGEFIDKFPENDLQNLTVDEYVVGHQTASFCNFVESKTRAWANIQGATSRKFGIYFGRTKTDPHQEYRVTRQFGTQKKEGFEAVKHALLELVRLGSKDKPDFAAIDANPLSQMFKAKILSLYFPQRFLAICSEEALDEIAGKLNLPGSMYRSEIQHQLVGVKENNPITKGWSYPKFMRFLYDTYIRKEKKTAVIRRPRKKVHRRVNFEDVQNERAAIGKKAEAYALTWEKQRLTGAGLGHLIEKIDDRTDRPGYGYDFLSHTAARQPRYIEVKSVSKQGNQHRFFLSDNEHTVSHSAEHRDSYYFYLVRFDGAGEPVELKPRLAKDLYPAADIAPASYFVLVDLEDEP